MHHGNKDQWIANIGIIDGRLHIQVGSNFNKNFGPSDPYLSIKDEDGEFIGYEGSKIFLTDRKGRILEINEINPDLAKYKCEEFIFLIVKEREVYEVYSNGYVSHGVSGHWEVETDLVKDSKNIRTINKKLNIGDYKIRRIYLNPLGLKISAGYSESKFKGYLKIELETKDGLVQLDNGGGSINSGESKFDMDYKTRRPIDIDRVEAIIIDGFRLELK